MTNPPAASKRWKENKKTTPEKLEAARLALEEVRQGVSPLEALRRNPLPSGGHASKSAMVTVYRQMVADGEMEDDPALLRRIRMKPSRTLSGVTTVTVLTKPYPCPGQCIFCPDEARMPKSYLADEPGAARAVQNNFDPYDQVRTRIDTYEAVGHPTDKIELLILGGTWSAYPPTYKEWFLLRCFDAMNESRVRYPGRSAPHQRDRPPPQRGAGNRDPPGRDHPRRAARPAPDGCHQGPDGRAEPG